MNTLTPIPTKYNGQLFRSKLEAKWAAYFDLCGGKWEYEPQAFELGDGVRYLPDFCAKNVYSVHGKCGEQMLSNSYVYPLFWFECKGVMSDYDDVKIQKFRDAISEVEEGEDCLGKWQITKTPFLVLDRTPAQMFADEEQGEGFSFWGIEEDEYPFVIGRTLAGDMGLIGADCNYRRLMDPRSEEWAHQVESMFRWEP